MAATITRNCPKCGGSLISAASDPTRKTCAGCGARFLLPTNPAAVARVPAAPAPANAFADLGAPRPAAQAVRPPAPKPRAAGQDSQLRLVLLLAGGLAVVFLGLATTVVLAVVFWPRPAAQTTVAAAAPPVAIAPPPADPIILPAPTTPSGDDDPRPTTPPNKPTLPNNDPPPIQDAPPPQPTPPPDVNPTPAPQPAADVKADDPVNKAIDKAVAFLKKEAVNGPQQNGGGGFGFVGGQQVGVMGLIGLALLESGVPADDPAVAAATSAVRNGAATCSATYEMSIALWFLDRLGDPKDEDAIHDLGARLIAGQLEHGKWTYNCPTGNAAGLRGPVGPRGFGGLMTAELTQEQLKELISTLDKYDPSKEIPAGKRLAPVCKYVRGMKFEKVGTAPGRPQEMMAIGAGDLSLTQFAVLGLWVARKHHLPVDRSLLLAEAHVRSVQGADGGWAYSEFGMGPTDSMTCSGLMELAAGRAVGQSEGGKPETADPQFEKGIQYLAELFDRGVPPPKPANAQQAQNLQQAVARSSRSPARFSLALHRGRKKRTGRKTCRRSRRRSRRPWPSTCRPTRKKTFRRSTTTSNKP